jgi:hypothetical protein
VQLGQEVANRFKRRPWAATRGRFASQISFLGAAISALGFASAAKSVCRSTASRHTVCHRNSLISLVGRNLRPIPMLVPPLADKRARRGCSIGGLVLVLTSLDFWRSQSRRKTEPTVVSLTNTPSPTVPTFLLRRVRVPSEKEPPPRDPRSTEARAGKRSRSHTPRRVGRSRDLVGPLHAPAEGGGHRDNSVGYPTFPFMPSAEHMPPKAGRHGRRGPRLARSNRRPSLVRGYGQRHTT